MVSNFFPQDTRVAELSSAGALILMGLFLPLHGEITPSMTALHPELFWSMLFFCLGGLQLSTLILYPRIEIGRVALALLTGTWWVFTALKGITTAPIPTDWGAFFLGVANLYGFMMGFLYLRSTWK